MPSRITWRQFCTSGQHYDVIHGLNETWNGSDDRVRLKGKRDYVELAQKSVLHVYPAATTEIKKLGTKIYALIVDKPEGWHSTTTRLAAAPKEGWKSKPAKWTVIKLTENRNCLNSYLIS